MFFRPISGAGFSRQRVVEMAAKCAACNDLPLIRVGGCMAVRVQLDEP